MSALYERIEELCRARGINITVMCRESGVARGSLTDLKMGRIEGLSARALGKLADYFEVPMEYLLGMETEKKPAPGGGREVTLDDFSYAMYRESRVLTEENKKKLLEMAEFFRRQQGKDRD